MIGGTHGRRRVAVAMRTARFVRHPATVQASGSRRGRGVARLPKSLTGTFLGAKAGPFQGMRRFGQHKEIPNFFKAGSFFLKISFSFLGKRGERSPPSHFANCPARPILPRTSPGSGAAASRARMLDDVVSAGPPMSTPRGMTQSRCPETDPIRPRFARQGSRRMRRLSLQARASTLSVCDPS
jgi:hypothetical protein